MESQIANIQSNGYLELESQVSESGLMEFRKEFANKAIDFWLIAEGSDHYRNRKEREKVLSYIQQLFLPGSLFGPERYDESKRKEILLELVGLKTNIRELSNITDFVRKNKALSLAFLYDACIIIHLDGRVVSSEHDFLNTFVKLTNITEEEKKKVLVKFQSS